MELNNIILCQFIEIEYSLYWCEKCGAKVVSYDNNYPILICPIGIAPRIQQIQNDKNALKNLHKNTQDLCTDEQITERLNICHGCEFFNSKQSVCDKCGCSLSKQREFINKLALPEASCPIGKWK
jgi:hypothetical protein